VAATRLWRRLAGLLGGLLAAGGARAVGLPDDVAEAMVHVYNGGGVTASGPALLVRKSLSDRVSLTGSYYVDMVSNASIDVVTTASPYKETRNAYGLGMNYVERNSLITLAVASSKEPDYLANAVNLDVAQDVFGGMTTVNLGFTRGTDKVGKHGTPGYFDTADHWRYRLGVTQILTPDWLLTANAEAISDDGYLGSPYRVALVYGAAVPERVPRTRTSRAFQLRAVGDLGEHNVVRGVYRYFWDTWSITAHTAELGYSRYIGESWQADAFVRYHAQQGASFYSDNATSETTYVTRNRQLSTFNDTGVGALIAYTAARVPGSYAVTINGSVEALRFKYSDFTDIRTGKLYGFDALLAQLLVSVTF
jgi:hypothetical protein